MIAPSASNDRPDVIVIARSAIAAAPIAEMQALCDALASRQVAAHTTFAFTEQGEPALRDRLRERIDAGARRIVLVPLLVPMEPGLANWIAKALARWQAADGKPWPPVLLAPPPMAMPGAADLLALAVGAADHHPQPPPPPLKAEGSIVPAQKHRVLVCHGAPCTAAGAALVWGHLRGEQARRSLRTAGEGMMSAKATCLGPCSLAPVVQVWPEGTTYGGVDEAGVDAIIERHILSGGIADGYAYPADGRKQRLRRTGA
ncbi:(2Fe-2S) ferredoxin domain-containing protein [Novosphingobium resinovorum]|uniref:(2Fe-2S) ferredoxin domain-containing protein n=1 Tax=Novosphingobium resinovorum TaxID=158500 RepID=UPI002ED08755|nr:(2Fe-2S) ferredoxin domain-containing protein [Novosphingobium resinovorum]